MDYINSIYKLDTKGKVRVLTVSADNGILTQESGLLNGKLVAKHTQCKPKNVGKANATTAVEQAILEAKAKIETKMSEGYFETILEAENTKVVLPMLAKEFDKESHKINWSGHVYVQPKLDGMRMLRTEKFISRKGKTIDTLDHIADELDSLWGADGHIFDGEAYAHGKTFQENMKLIKKYRPGETEQVCYHIYDVAIEGKTYTERIEILRDVFSTDPAKHVKLVPTYRINSINELMRFHEQFIKEGYEGSIVRHGNDEYKINGRSSSLLKVKNFIDIDAETIDIIPNEKDPTHGTPVLKYNGKTFKSGVRMSHDERKEMLTNKEDYIGKKANVRFFEYTDDGIPRFPVTIGFHEDR